MVAFIKGSATSRLEILTQHPQVEGLIFLSKGRVTVAYFPRIVLDVDENGIMSSVLAAVVGSPDNNTVITIDKRLVSDNYEVVFDAESLDTDLPFVEVQNLIAKFPENHGLLYRSCHW